MNRKNQSESSEENSSENDNLGKDDEWWEIQLLNDTTNRRTFVAKCIHEICGKSDADSYRIMMKAHRDGYVLRVTNDECERESSLHYYNIKKRIMAL